MQIDVFGEIADAALQTYTAGLGPSERGKAMRPLILEYLAGAWREPDEGIGEVRGGRRHFVHSKVMAWVSFDRAAQELSARTFNDSTVRWRALADEIHAEVCEHGFDRELGSFVQSYGSKRLDASLLLIPLVGFLPARDRRVRGTIAAVERELLEDGFGKRYAHDETSEELDGLPPGEGAFLPCTFWLADNLALTGRRDEARRLFERLLTLRN